MVKDIIILENMSHNSSQDDDEPELNRTVSEIDLFDNESETENTSEYGNENYPPIIIRNQSTGDGNFSYCPMNLNNSNYLSTSETTTSESHETDYSESEPISFHESLFRFHMRDKRQTHASRTPKESPNSSLSSSGYSISDKASHPKTSNMHSHPKNLQAGSLFCLNSSELHLVDYKSPKDLIQMVHKFTGKRSSRDFFLSAIREKTDADKFKINVIDKQSGEVLGNICLNEDQFHKARQDGFFDNFLSLFLLNS